MTVPSWRQPAGPTSLACKRGKPNTSSTGSICEAGIALQIVADEIQRLRRLPLCRPAQPGQHAALANDQEGGRQALPRQGAPQHPLGTQGDQPVLPVDGGEGGVTTRTPVAGR